MSYFKRETLVEYDGLTFEVEYEVYEDLDKMEADVEIVKVLIDQVDLVDHLSHNVLSGIQDYLELISNNEILDGGYDG